MAKQIKDAGSVNGSAICATEDAAVRRFAVARTEPGSLDRTRHSAQKRKAKRRGRKRGKRGAKQSAVALRSAAR